MIFRTLFGFKNLKGDFVARRFIHGLQELKKEGYAPFDDISVGGICM